MKRLSKPLSQLDAKYDAVVVGSGYGGGAAASRLARMGLRVAVLERGEEMIPGEYPDTSIEAIAQAQVEGRAGRIGSRTALFDLRVGRDINVLVGCGLGGTSLINANVSLEADPRVFDDPAWPAGLRTHLDEGYARARAMLKPRPYPAGQPDFPMVNKLRAMDAASKALGAELQLPPINVAFEEGYNPAGVWQPACNLCGDCCSGCNTGAKSTTLMNYLPDAAAFGAEIFCGLRVRSVSRRPDGDWNVHYAPQGLGRERFDAEEPAVCADIVVLAAGTLGSTEILLRSRERGLPLSDRLGKGFTGNGDVLAFGYNNECPIDGIGFGETARTYDVHHDAKRPVGPTITGLIDLRGTEDLEKGIVIEEGAIPGGIAPLLPGIMAAAAAALGDDTDRNDGFEEKAREVESLVRGPYRGAVNHTQTFLVMSHDGADGEMKLDGDRLAVEWPEVGSKDVFKRVAAKVREAVAATGGTYVPNPVWSEVFEHDLITVHPLGGCAMGEDAASGVVDADCRVYAGHAGSDVHPGLLVCDGSVMPRPLGVNPLLTITAVTERAMIRLAEAKGRVIDLAPAPRQPREVAGPATIGIRFTEKMGGTVAPAGGGSPVPAHFVVTVVAPDADRLLHDEAHEADLIGTFHLPALSNAPLVVTGGRFNLFTRTVDRALTKQMEYRMPLTAEDGSRYFVYGRKLIHDDPGFDLWTDTTTLFVEVRGGPDESGPLLYDGTLTIDPRDFARQLTTMTVTSAPTLLKRLDTIRKFSLFFAGQLFDTYAGLATGPETKRIVIETPQPGLSVFPPIFGVRRTLTCPPLERIDFPARDGARLCLHRTSGGGRGPVLLAPGTAMTALSYCIDTVPQNLVEYLVAEGFDVWLFDWRTSPLLDARRQPYTLDDVARFDWPAAVEEVRRRSGRDQISVLAHCLSAPAFLLSLLRGHVEPGAIRSFVASQVALHLRFTPPGTAKLRLHLDKLLPRRQMIHQRPRDARFHLSDLAASFLARVLPTSFSCDNRACYRHVATFGELVLHGRINEATHALMGDLVPECLTAFLKDVAVQGRRDSILTDADLLHLDRLKLPIHFISGSENRMFIPQSTGDSYRLLCEANGPSYYRRTVYPGFGHLDCYLSRDAATVIWPDLAASLDPGTEEAGLDPTAALQPS